jgi:hypothetical protein
MPLDNFDANILQEHGLAQDIIKKVYNRDIAQNSAKKYLAGIRLHLEHKSKMVKEDRPISEMEEVVVKQDGSRTTTRMLLLSEEDQQSPTRIMALMGYDPLQWELISCKSRRNYWDTSMKLKDENKVTSSAKSTNHAFMVTLTVKPIQNKITSEIVRAVFEDLKPAKFTEYEYHPGNLMLELPIMDLHLGKLAWKDETGEDYDLKIAEKLYRDTVNDILSRVKAYGLVIDKIIFPIGNDFFHVDSTENTTTAGTQLDYDTRWQKMYKKGIELLVWAIDQCREVAPVECMYVPGNHDEMLSFCAVVSVSCYYRECQSVKVNTSASPRKYVHYGVNLIGYAHGKEEGDRISGLMQIEQPEAWGVTEFREWHLGDLHHESSKEANGIIIRRLSTITATDAWHAQKGYKGSIRKASAFVWDKACGKILTIDSIVKG